MSYSISRRTREIGIRIALGAQLREVRRMILIRAMRMTCCGIAIGLVGAVALSKVLTAFLYGVSTTDGQSFGFAATILFVVAMVANCLPIRRATHVDPLVAVRWE